jgi:hypothetical protein
MIHKVHLKRVIVVVFSTAMFTDAGIACAFDMCRNMFDMMNRTKLSQSEWRGDYRDRDRYYGDPEVASVYGYGSSAYGYGPATTLGYGYTVPAYATPQPGNDALLAEIHELQLRIKNLEKALTRESLNQ